MGGGIEGILCIDDDVSLASSNTISDGGGSLGETSDDDASTFVDFARFPSLSGVLEN